jgi:nitrogen regulatory protein PII-like uncharacterized protein
MTADELCIEVSVQTMIDALEDSGDYKVFTVDEDGIENAVDWITDEADADTILGPIDSESIIKHLEESIDAMVCMKNPTITSLAYSSSIYNVRDISEISSQ